MKKRATKRRGLIESVTRAMVETLEQRVLYDVTYLDFSGDGSVQEGQVVKYNISAATDHDFITGTVVHASVQIQQTGNDGSQTYTGYNLDLQPGQSQNLFVFAKEEGSIVAEAEVWDDPMTTYGFTSSEQAESVDTAVVDAPLSPMNGMFSFFDETDTSPSATNARAIAEFTDANPNAKASDFSVTSIDWDDATGTDQSGYVQKDIDGVNWDVMAYHNYGGPNPATSLDGDGAWYPQATVKDEGGATVTALGKAAVTAGFWLNATANPVKAPPGQLPQPNNDVIDFNAPVTVPGAVRVITFYVGEYTGNTNIGPPQTLISPNLVTVTELPDETATIQPGIAPSAVGINPHWNNTKTAVVGYEFVKVSITVTNAWNGNFLDLRVVDPWSGGSCRVRCNFNLISTR